MESTLILEGDNMIYKAPDILLPNSDIDYSKWACVACDQFTSQPEYWQELDKFCGDYSTLRIVYPEVYLGLNEQERIACINKNMQDYLNKGIFNEHKNTYILIERTTSYGNKRIGLMLAVDLEKYEYKPLSYAPIKATELTVKERIPVRVKIRENAVIETSHIMLLMDNAERDILEPLYENRDNLEKLYDFQLNMNGGTLKGYKVTDNQELEAKLNRLISKDVLMSKYGVDDNPFLFAVGDGNHSLATAKACWDKIKDTVNDKENHPARYALAELVNIYDEDLKFEPIHRVMFGVGAEFVSDFMSKVSRGEDSAYIVYNGVRIAFQIDSFKPQAIADIQAYLDDYLANHYEASIDYVHGEKYTIDVATQHNGVAILMPTIAKSELFKYVLTRDVLCRKSFSMGEAEEKRYYVECKKIKE